MTANANLSLYAIAEGFRGLEEYLTNLGGDVSDAEVEAEVIQRFTELNLSRDQKLEAYGMLIKNLDLRVTVRKAEAKRLTELAKSDETALKRLKGNLTQIFDMFEWDEIQTTHFKFNPCDNGGILPVEIDEHFAKNPELLSEEFRNTSYSVNLDAIRKALQNGKELPFAKLGERGKYVKIS